ncbi:MAG: ABC transporter substrate-binding protein [Bacteroidales bacterium]
MKATLIRALLILIVSAASAGNPPLRFSPQWLPQAQFAGFYVASDQGFYQEAGLNVEIVHPRANVNVMELLKDGEVDVVSQFLVSAITARDQGLDLVNIAQLSQHSAILFVSKKSSGIEAISDFQGKKIGVWQSGFGEIPMAMVRDHDLEVEWVPVLSTVNLFLVDGIDLMTVMWYNEYNQIYLSGINRDELNTFFLSDYGFNVPEDGLYTLRETRAQRPEEMKAFVEATLKGWKYAENNQDYTVELVLEEMRQANIPANPAHQRWMLEKVLELQKTDDKNVIRGELHPDDFNMAVNILKDREMIEQESLSFRNFFLPVLPDIE